MKKCYLESMSREISYMKYENRRLTGLVTSYAETAFVRQPMPSRLTMVPLHLQQNNTETDDLGHAHYQRKHFFDLEKVAQRRLHLIIPSLETNQLFCSYLIC
jgi:hypothetical protein